ncbi:hypothetical protein BDA96_01G224500 [Sorghum bicolor]|uniref:Uncharacterized protein n=1 Tax=Sorghum bicolor TaxID=4558 RepID=A0A921UY28_SORBI|nr:hypothetical protein BDA96_01G224500 [Sorghum bicolor]
MSDSMTCSSVPMAGQFCPHPMICAPVPAHIVGCSDGPHFIYKKAYRLDLTSTRHIVLCIRHSKAEEL